MRWVPSLLVAAGCNQVFGLRETAPVDAAFFDAPPDAAWQCPADGGEPLFRPQYLQVPVKSCS